MEVPNVHGRKSMIPGAQGIDRKTLNKILAKKSKPEDQPDADEHEDQFVGDTDLSRTKYQVEKDGETPTPPSALQQTLLDSSSVFRSRTAVPHGLLFDLYEEVYIIIEALLEEYITFNKVCYVCIDRHDENMDEFTEDCRKSLKTIKEHIGMDCDALPPDEYTTNKIYADAKIGNLWYQDSCPTEKKVS